MKNNQTNISIYSKFVKYFIMAFVVYLALYYIPEIKLDFKENLMISAISSMTFAIFDMISPSINFTSSIS